MKDRQIRKTLNTREPNMDNQNKNVQEIINTYDSYKTKKPKYCTYGDIAHIYRLSEKYMAIIRLLESHNISNLEEKEILGIGCGNGSLLRFFSGCRGNYKGLYGIDIREEIIEQGLNIAPSMNISTSNAEDYPFPKNSIDIVCLQTVFSSINDPAMKENIVDKINHILKPQGLIIWYDFRYNNPRNTNVKGMKKSEINELFKSYKIELKKITTLPFLQRKIPHQFWPLLGLTSQLFPFLKSHYVGIFVKKC